MGLQFLVIVFGVILILHGLVHLLGFALYWKLTDIEGLTYKTTFLGGRINLGEINMKIYGALWLLCMLGFLVASVGIFTRQYWWPTLTIMTAILSLVITIMDWSEARFGVIVNIGILIVLAFSFYWG